MRFHRLAAALPLLAVAPMSVLAQGGVDLPPFIEATVLKPPTVALGSDGRVLAYELHITSFEQADCTLEELQVINATTGETVVVLRDSALIKALVLPGRGQAGSDGNELAPGQRVIAFFWVPLGGVRPPAKLRHRLTLRRGDQERILDVAPVTVAAEVSRLGPPLRGGDWLAAGGPGSTSWHRSVFPIDGAVRFAQRFAIDFVMVDSTGKTFKGDSLKNESYYAHGQEALAVADGTVVTAKDGIPENDPLSSSRAVLITLETAAGNHVILDIGGGRFASYAHLKPGSLKVKAGQRVKRGTVLGLVGNSGQTTLPHLHFQLTDASSLSLLGSEGLPYAVDRFDLIGSCSNMLSGTCRREMPKVVRLAMPFDNQLVRFPM